MVFEKTFQDADFLEAVKKAFKGVGTYDGQDVNATIGNVTTTFSGQLTDDVVIEAMETVLSNSGVKMVNFHSVKASLVSRLSDESGNLKELMVTIKGHFEIA